MKKILVTTDLSNASIAGIRFAIQLSIQKNVELIFLHVNKIMDQTFFPNPERKAIAMNERDNLRRELEAFVNNVYSSLGIKPGSHQYVLYYHFGVVNSIMEYAEKTDCSYICISTNGAGSVKKFFGTFTSTLISESKIPILCIPQNYHPEPITRILYASDLTNYDHELKLVVDFAKIIASEVRMVHFYIKGTPMSNEEALREEIRNKFQYNIATYFEERTANTLLEEIDKVVDKFAPSILVLFTVMDQSFFDLLFLTSNSERYSFRTQVPLLVFKK